MNVLLALFVILAIVYIAVAFIIGFIDNLNEPLIIDYATFRKLQKRGQITEIHADRIWYKIDGVCHSVCPHWTWYPILWTIVFRNSLHVDKLEID